MNLRQALYRVMAFGSVDVNGQGKISKSEVMAEYELIKQKKSKLSANKRRAIVDAVESNR